MRRTVYLSLWASLLSITMGPCCVSARALHHLKGQPTQMQMSSQIRERLQMPWQGGTWETAGTLSNRASGTGLELSFPGDLIRKDHSPLFVDFHRADDIQALTDVSALGLHGDSAPHRRWNYRYEVAR